MHLLLSYVVIACTGASLVGASWGTGISGKPGDFALNLSAADAMGSLATTNNASFAKVTNPAIQNLTSFTVTGWIKGDEAPGAAARLVQYTGGNNGMSATSTRVTPVALA
jgi:hypothetical protein